MPKLESPIVACLALIVLASLAFVLSLRESAAASADQWQVPPAATATATVIVAASPTMSPPPTASTPPTLTTTAPPPPTVTTAAPASPTAIPTLAPTATAPAPAPTPAPAASPTPEPSSLPAATPTPASPTAVVAVEWLNLREGPGTEYPVITALSQGDILTLTGEQRLVGTNRWVAVIAADGQQGWVFGGSIAMP